MPESAVWAIWALPLAAFVVISALVPTGVFRRAPVLAALISMVAMFASFCLALWAFIEAWNDHGERVGFAPHHWLTVGPLNIEFGITLDGLTAMMLLVVTAVSLLVQFYSVEYMKGDRGYARYYAILSLFTMSMIGLVLGSSLLLVFVFWELVGLCSYLLIGFWFERESPAEGQLPPRTAAKKAFLITRLGDVGFLLALILIWTVTRTFDIPALQELAHAGAISQIVLFLFCMDIFAGAAGKSAQFPLHTWLPDAMAGPTPVSALIHAATMVAAGVYLVGRLFPIFESTQGALNVVTAIGAITAVIAALMGLVMHDIKRVLAYSTISQLGYMMLALGVGGYVAAFFHLMTHAFFKALLFLGSGSVSHSTNTFDMRKMGGLAGPMPITFITFLIGALALSGIWPLSGFFSKDEILVDAWLKSRWAFWAAAAVVFLTAFYMFRAISMTFLGDYRGGEAGGHHGGDDHEWADDDHAAHPNEPHESPIMMTLPLMILAVPAVIAGLVNAGGGYFGKPLEQLLEGSLPEWARHPAPDFNWIIALSTSFVAVFAILLALTIYGWGPRWQVSVGPFQWAYTILQNRFYLDALYETVIAKGLVVNGIARLASFIDSRIIDGAVNGSGWLTRRTAAGLTALQNGQTQAYGAVLLGGVVVIAVVMFLAVL